MSIDPINPGYLDRVFDGALHEPHRIERIPKRDERERSDDESERRRNDQPGDQLDEDFDAVLVDAEHDDGHDSTLEAEPELHSEEDDVAEDPDEDSVVVELDEFSPPLQPERRRQVPTDGHIDFEA